MKKILVFLIIILLGACGWFAWEHVQAPKAGLSSVSTIEKMEALPEYSGQAAVEVDGGRPAFADKELRPEFREEFTELDRLGRCGQVTACVDREHMPEGERGSIGMVRPSGWQIAKYDFIDNGGYLFNRCHLIGWQLTGENAEVRNLITGTRYMNVEGMLPFENQVASYVRSTGNHVLYRVTPVFRGKELVARGVQIEAESVEDKGEGLAFNVYCYNVQPGVEIDYRTGDNRLADRSRLAEDQLTEGDQPAERNQLPEEEQPAESNQLAGQEMEYILNTNTHRFHYPDCSSVRDMKEKNKREYQGAREELIEQGYQPCGVCKP